MARHPLANPTLAVALVIVMVAGFGSDPVNTESPAFAHAFGYSDTWAGAIVAFPSRTESCARVPAAVLGRRRRRRVQRARRGRPRPVLGPLSHRDAASLRRARRAAARARRRDGSRRRSARRRETRPALGEGESTRGYVTRCATDACCCWLLTLGTGIGVVVYVQFDSVLGVFLHLDRGYALATWGAVFAISPVLVAVFQFAVSRWAGRRSARAMLAAAVVVARSRRRGPPAWSPGFGSSLSGHGEVMLTLALPLSLVAALCFRRLPADYAVRPCAAPSS